MEQYFYLFIRSGCYLCLDSSRNGCQPSSDPCFCEWHQNETRYEEIAMRSKVIQLENMKEDILQIFDEFRNEVHLKQRGSPIKSWRMPSVTKFLEIATKKLKWEANYAVEKVLPLLSRWIIIHSIENQCNYEELPMQPLRIVKKRVKRFVSLLNSLNSYNLLFPNK